MKTTKKFILEEVKKVISEAAKIKFAGHQFMLKVDVNEDPNKKGLKIRTISSKVTCLLPNETDFA